LHTLAQFHRKPLSDKDTFGESSFTGELRFFAVAVEDVVCVELHDILRIIGPQAAEDLVPEARILISRDVNGVLTAVPKHRVVAVSGY
jgi:hypothetical protein